MNRTVAVRGSDAPPHGARPPTATSSCVICTVPRSGSWLLSEGLSQAGIGRPEEFLRRDWYLRFDDRGRLEYQHRLHRAQCWPDGSAWCAPRQRSTWAAARPDARADYWSFLRATLEVGTTGAVFGIKMHRGQLEDAVALARVTRPDVSDVDLMRAWLPAPRFVFLHRRDQLRRAVSHFRALRSDVWWRTAGADGARSAPDDPDVDPVAIHRLLRRGRRELTSWRAFFHRMGVTPLDVAYEDLAVDPAGAVSRVIAHMGAGTPRTAPDEPPRLRRQADGWTDHAVHTYLTWRRTHAPPSAGYGADYTDHDDEIGDDVSET